MKRKVEKIQNKRLVYCPKNELTENEILVREIGSKVNLYKRNCDGEIEQIESIKDYSDYKNIDCVKAKILGHGKFSIYTTKSSEILNASDVLGFCIKERETDCLVRIPRFVFNSNIIKDVPMQSYVGTLHDEFFIINCDANKRIHIVNSFYTDNIFDKYFLDSTRQILVMYYHADTNTLTEVPDGKYFINCIPMYVEFKNGDCITEEGAVQKLHYSIYSKRSFNPKALGPNFTPMQRNLDIGNYSNIKLKKGWLSPFTSSSKIDIIRKYKLKDI